MKFRRLISATVALVMVIALFPVASLAEGVAATVEEVKAMRTLDRVWVELDAVEADALANGLDRSEVIRAIYDAALNIDSVDKDSFSDFTNDGFFFTVDGMYCAYNYRLRNELSPGAVPVPEEEHIVVVKGSKEALKNSAGSPDVLLVAPYYGHDSSFTGQYKTEAQSIAEITGGTYTLIQSAGATGPAIAENYPDKGVIIYDSHGSLSGTSSYLCLTTNEGITTNDYSNGWAVRDGSSRAWIDGRYIENHISKNLSDCFVWMAICQGMNKSGNGTTGSALLRAGAGCVYGYSQNVTFVGDYKYEAEFWTHMKTGETVAEAYNAMVAEHGVHDPNGNAYPVVMSQVDEFPANPDSAQVVNCDWSLFGGAAIDLEAYALSNEYVDIYLGKTQSIVFNPQPFNATNYELEWISSDTEIFTVNGNQRRCYISAVGIGIAQLTCNVFVAGEQIGSLNANISVTEDTRLRDALNVNAGTIKFSTDEEYPFVTVEDADRYYAMSGNAGKPKSTSSFTTTLQMRAGETLSFEYFTSSEANYDYFKFYVNGTEEFKKSGTGAKTWKTYTFTAPAHDTYTFTWSFIKDESTNKGEDCVKIDNIKYSGMRGDVDGNGIVDISDVVIAMRIALGIIKPTEHQSVRGDFDGSGMLDIVDVAFILRYALGAQ